MRGVATAATPTKWFGFNDGSVIAGQATADKSAQLSRNAGANTVRVTVDWRWVEGTENAVDLSRYDAIYNAAIARGVRPLFVLTHAPPWTWAAGQTCLPGQDCRYPPAREHDDDWERMAARLASRYPQLAAIEVWNEPNSTAFWHGGVDFARYVELVKRARVAIKRVRPALPVIAGALTTQMEDDPAAGMTVQAYLQRLYDAGIKGQMDGLSLHPYPGDIDPWYVYRALSTVREVRDANGDATPLWITETGVTSVGANANGAIDENGQALLLARLRARFGEMADVNATIVHSLVEPTFFAASDPERGYGVVRPTLAPKPAYCAFAPTACSLRPQEDPVQSARWAAQDLLQIAADAARKYHRERGTYAGLTAAYLRSYDRRLSGTSPTGDVTPGASADPARIGVWAYAVPDKALLCNASKADRSYCIETVYRSYWRYGHASASMWGAAGATTTGAVWWW